MGLSGDGKEECSHVFDVVLTFVAFAFAAGSREECIAGRVVIKEMRRDECRKEKKV